MTLRSYACRGTASSQMISEDQLPRTGARAADGRESGDLNDGRSRARPVPSLATCTGRERQRTSQSNSAESEKVVIETPPIPMTHGSVG